VSLVHALMWIGIASLAVGTAWEMAADLWPCQCGCGNPLHKHNPLRRH
jgi:hypothetical protein